MRIVGFSVPIAVVSLSLSWCVSAFHPSKSNLMKWIQSNALDAMPIEHFGNSWTEFYSWISFRKVEKEKNVFRWKYLEGEKRQRPIIRRPCIVFCVLHVSICQKLVHTHIQVRARHQSIHVLWTKKTFAKNIVECMFVWCVHVTLFALYECVSVCACWRESHKNNLLLCSNKFSHCLYFILVIFFAHFDLKTWFFLWKTA